MKRFFLAVIAFCSLLAVQAQSFTINPEMVRKVQAAEFFISHFYVDSLSEGKVVDSAIEGMLKQLDPHSTYSAEGTEMETCRPHRDDADCSAP